MIWVVQRYCSLLYLTKPFTNGLISNILVFVEMIECIVYAVYNFNLNNVLYCNFLLACMSKMNRLILLSLGGEGIANPPWLH